MTTNPSGYQAKKGAQFWTFHHYDLKMVLFALKPESYYFTKQSSIQVHYRPYVVQLQRMVTKIITVYRIIWTKPK